MKMKKALVVGINYYESINQLHGCVNDARSVKETLERNGDGSSNFDVKILESSNQDSMIKRTELKDQIENLFSGDPDIALFYFSGHGSIETTGGYLLTSDAQRKDEGLSLNDIILIANKSKVKNKIIILDSCYSGVASESSISTLSEVSEGMTILTASTKNQYAIEKQGSGVFTSLLVHALDGAAANLVGDITPGSVYAHIDQALGAWEQRPVFKTNVKSFISLKKVKPPISIDNLRKLIEFFPKPNFEFKLDPTYEPEMKGRDKGMPDPILENTEKFEILQKYNRINLLVPVNAPHMWHAAMKSKSCKLTALGEHYRKLVEKNKI